MTAARRPFRTAGLLFGPVVWLFALLGAGLAAFPAWPLVTGGGPVRPSAAVKVGVRSGHWTLLDPTGAPTAAGEWHPRVLTAERLGGPIPDGWPGLFTDPEVDPETAALAFAYFGSTVWQEALPGTRSPALGFAAGTTAAGPREFRGLANRWDDELDGDDADANFIAHLGPPHRVHRFAVSLWPLLILAGLIGAARWGFAARRGAAADDANARFPLFARLARPWVWGLAAAGLVCTTAVELSVGGTDWNVDIVRGPADGPHPRAFRFYTSGEAERADERGWSANAPTCGVWRETACGPGSPGEPWESATLAVSLWYFAAVGLAGNAAALWRRSGCADGGTA